MYGTLLPLDRELIKRLYIDDQTWEAVEIDTQINHSILVRKVSRIFGIMSEKIDGSESNEEIANEVLAGAWGNGDDRKNRLSAAGYDYNAIQAIVNQKAAPAEKSNEEIAKEVLAGKWGNNPQRKAKLEAAGYNYATIQALVNKMC